MFQKFNNPADQHFSFFFETFLNVFITGLPSVPMSVCFVIYCKDDSQEKRGGIHCICSYYLLVIYQLLCRGLLCPITRQNLCPTFWVRFQSLATINKPSISAQLPSFSAFKYLVVYYHPPLFPFHLECTKPSSPSTTLRPF